MDILKLTEGEKDFASSKMVMSVSGLLIQLILVQVHCTFLETYNPSSSWYNLVWSGAYQLQMIASKFNGSSSVGTRSNHNLHLCTRRSKVTITTNGNVGVRTKEPVEKDYSFRGYAELVGDLIVEEMWCMY